MGGREESPSASEAEQTVEHQRYRVRVCLQRFFSDERARCYVWVCGARRVRWLARRLRRLFALPPALALVSRGYLLPLDEPLALLAPDDLVDVIPLTEDLLTNGKCDADGVEWSGGDELDCKSSAVAFPAKRQRCYDVHESDAAVPDASPNRDESPAPSLPLQEVKRRALRLLDDVTGATDTHTAPRARRRRVRRRRAPQPSPSRDPPASPAPPALVQRNSGAAPRPPRAVHALPPGAAHSRTGEVED